MLLLTSERELLEAEVFKHNCNRLYPLMLYRITILEQGLLEYCNSITYCVFEYELCIMYGEEDTVLTAQLPSAQ